MAGNNSSMGALMMPTAMKAIDDKDVKLTPFHVKIEMTPVSILSSIEANRKILKDMGAEEWFKETQERLEPILKEQVKKFAELVKNKFGLEFVDGDDMSTT